VGRVKTVVTNRL